MHVSPLILSLFLYCWSRPSIIYGLLNLTFDVACNEAWTTRGVKCLLNGNDARIVTKYFCFQGGLFYDRKNRKWNRKMKPCVPGMEELDYEDDMIIQV